MEKKKLLLVAISVGIFLVIAIGAAIVFAPKGAVPSGAVASHPASARHTGITVAPLPSYTPPPADPVVPVPSAAGSPQPATVDAVDLIRTPGDVPGLRPLPEGASQQGAGFHVNGTGNISGTVISVPSPSTAAVPNAPPAPRAAAPAPQPAPVAAAPRPAAQATPPAAAPARPAAQTRVYDDYWVQTGAFSTVAKAEGVKETLAAKGIASIIENRNVDGKTLFRVRVGPYTSKNEADYWLALIKTLNGFEDSQVRQTQSRR